MSNVLIAEYKALRDYNAELRDTGSVNQAVYYALLTYNTVMAQRTRIDEYHADLLKKHDEKAKHEVPNYAVWPNGDWCEINELEAFGADMSDDYVLVVDSPERELELKMLNRNALFIIDMCWSSVSSISDTLIKLQDAECLISETEVSQRFGELDARLSEYQRGTLKDATSSNVINFTDRLNRRMVNK